MPIATRIPSPTLVEFEAGDATGLDLMGLRLPVQTIGNHELNGITTITPTIRYLSFRTWLLYRYLRAQPPPPDRYSEFVRYARPAEAAFVMANLVRLSGTRGLIGRNEGARQLAEEEEPWVLEPLTDQSAVNNYARPSDQLRLTRTRDPGVPSLGEEHGLPLARAMDAAIGETSIGRRLGDGVPLDLVTRDELDEFGAVAWVSDIPGAERRELVGAVMPEEPSEDDLPRLRTYALLLALADLDGSVTEPALFAEVLSPAPRVPAVLGPALEGWTLYAVRDVIAVTGEAALEAVVRRLETADPDGSGIPDYRLVPTLLDAGRSDQELALRELRILTADEDLDALSIGELAERVRSATGGDEAVRNPRGIRRWSGPLTEPIIWDAVRGARDGALVLGLVAWLLAERRAGEGVRADAEGLRVLSHQGSTRFGMKQVIIPRLTEWHDHDLSIAAALGHYTHLAIDQHLRIVWTRLAQDPRKDVSVLLRDGDRILRRSGYVGGRTASRLEQAIRWLHQMALLEDSAITENGQRVLRRALVALEGA